MKNLSPVTATLGLVVFGTCASLIAKLIYSVRGMNSFGHEAPFTKPWFQVFGMFAGMSVCILMDLPKAKRTSAVDPGETEALLGTVETKAERASKAKPASSLWIINIPTLFDLFATACGTTGLLYTTVSVYQLLRGAQLVFSAFLSIIFLHRRLSLMNYIGITVCMIGITLVGLANVWGEEAHTGSKGNTAFGVILILLGQILQGAQVVVEEHLLQNLRISSVRIVAYEGMFGCLHCLLWVFPIIYMLPGSDHGRLEDPYDAFYMFVHSLPIAAVIFTDMAIMLLYNVCGMEVTNSLSAVSRVIIETLRTLLVWLCDLILFYFISSGRLGEPWTPYSYMQAAGFFLTCTATVIYNYDHLAAEYRSRQKVKEPESVPSAIVSAVTTDGLILIPEDKPVVQKVVDENIEEGIVRTKSRPLTVSGDGDIIESDDEEESDEDEEEHVGSFYGQAIGSASFGSYLVVGTPGGSRPSSLRHRGSLG